MLSEEGSWVGLLSGASSVNIDKTKGSLSDFFLIKISEEDPKKSKTEKDDALESEIVGHNIYLDTQNFSKK